MFIPRGLFGLEALGNLPFERFGKALTFLPVTVLQQLNSPPGCEAAAFTLMQSGGTMGAWAHNPAPN